MHNNITQPTAVIFLRARYQGSDGRDGAHEQQMIAHQRAACRRAAKTLDAHIIREYVEHGGTGRLDKRPVLRLMLDELRALRDADYVIVTSPDRLTRTTHDTAAVLFEIDAAGAELVTAANIISTKHRKEATV